MFGNRKERHNAAANVGRLWLCGNRPKWLLVPLTGSRMILRNLHGGYLLPCERSPRESQTDRDWSLS